MRKLDKTRRRWFALRSHNEERRRHRIPKPSDWGPIKRPSTVRRIAYRVQIWEGGEVEWAISATAGRKPPSPLCFDENPNDTYRFFAGLREGFQRAIGTNAGFVHRPQAALPRISTYYDFGQLSDISTAASIVLAAEYQRISTLIGVVPPTVNLNKWNPQVYAKLTQLGFFEILGIEKKVRPVVSDSGKTRTMRIVRAQNLDALEDIDQALTQLGLFLDPTDNLSENVFVQFLTGLSEAITNVIHHAYADGMEIPDKHINSLWVTATADRLDNSLTVVVYDQGATIPVTYPKVERLEKVRGYLERAIRRRVEQAFHRPSSSHPFEDDPIYIRAAMRYGGSRTDQRHRGLGLPQMFEALTRIGEGNLSIFSRGGWCKRTHNGRFTSGALSSSIGGTLVEWSVRLPQQGRTP
ncbi:ATP-binding protein [Mesorhizobium sp. M0621]|uniref:ATP-binding protein n=1 Tax=Mesorhizobium sp. M0621 TaxID=2956974 RepID=UPI00333C0EDB